MRTEIFILSVVPLGFQVKLKKTQTPEYLSFFSS